MSSIGTGGGFPISPLAGSVAGAAGQQRAAGAHQAAVDGAQKSFEAQRQVQLQRSVDDVSESAETGDRDADGREAWRWVKHPPNPGAQATGETPHSRDPDGELGQSLDFNA